MSTKKLPTWVSVLIAAVIIVGMLAVAAVGGAAFFIYRHVNTSFTPSENAQVEFTQERQKLESLRVLAYDRHAGKLVRVSIPFWLLRMAPSKNLSFLNDNGIDVDSDRVRLTVDDLERRGPGLLIDSQDRRGSLVLVWTE
jgi:hypothetical protein